MIDNNKCYNHYDYYVSIIIFIFICCRVVFRNNEFIFSDFLVLFVGTIGISFCIYRLIKKK